MYIFLTVLIVFAAVLLVLLVLVQNSKGGGLAADFNQGNKMMGVRKTTDFLEKTTWVLVAFIVLLSIFAVGVSKPKAAAGSAVIEQAEQIMEQANTPMQAFPEDGEE